MIRRRTKFEEKNREKKRFSGNYKIYKKQFLFSVIFVARVTHVIKFISKKTIIIKKKILQQTSTLENLKNKSILIIKPVISFIGTHILNIGAHILNIGAKYRLFTMML